MLNPPASYDSQFNIPERTTGLMQSTENVPPHHSLTHSLIPQSSLRQVHKIPQSDVWHCLHHAPCSTSQKHSLTVGKRKVTSPGASSAQSAIQCCRFKFKVSYHFPKVIQYPFTSSSSSSVSYISSNNVFQNAVPTQYVPPDTRYTNTVTMWHAFIYYCCKILGCYKRLNLQCLSF